MPCFRIRRKKCDETRPFCKRCLTTGRKCDGYVNEPLIEPLRKTEAASQRTWKSSAKHPLWDRPNAFRRGIEHDVGSIPAFHQKTPAYSNSTANDCNSDYSPYLPLYVAAPPQLKLASEIEYLCFDFFRHRTGPGFAGYFDSSTWASWILQACFLEPAVLYAVAAVGAVHRRYELGITLEAFKYCEIADRLQRQALLQWRARVAEDGLVTKPEIHMVLAKLLASFEAFQDNPELATKYMCSAFNHLLTQRVTRVMVQEQPVNVVLNHQTLRQFFLKLEHHMAYLCGISTDVQTYIVDKIEPGFEMPSRFPSLEQARNCLFAEVHHIWALDCEKSTPRDALDAIQRNHLGRLMIWSGAYAEWSQTRPATTGTLIKRIGRVLKWYREGAFLQLLLQTAPGVPLDEHMILSCDGDRTFLANSFHRQHCECTSSMTAHFARLSLLSDGIATETVPFATAALHCGSSTGIGLHLGSASCRSSDIRRQMTALLTPAMGDADKVWNTLGVYTIAERVSAFEEVAAETAAARRHDSGLCERAAARDKTEATDPQLTETEMKWVDITYFIEARMLCLIYCKPSTSENGYSPRQGFVWVREWFQLL